MAIAVNSVETRSTTDKFAAMVGFARRAGKIVYGYDELKRDRKCKIMAVSAREQGNILDNMKSLCLRRSVPLVAVEDIAEFVGNGCKAFGIADANMAKAMLDYLDSGNALTRYKVIAITEV